MKKMVMIVVTLATLSFGQRTYADFFQDAWQKAQQKAQDIKQKVQATMQNLKQKAEAQWSESQQKATQAFEDLKSRAPEILQGVPRAILQDKSPHAKTVAMVRHSGELGDHERQVLQKRDPLIRQKIRQVLGLDVTTVPRIALCCSGGGYRAMLATLGFTKAVRDIGVLDMASYMAGLSGSTWLFAPWVLRDIDLDSYERLLLPKIALDLRKTPIKPEAMSFKFLQKKFHGQDLSLVDVWGSVVANGLLSDLNKGGLFSHLSNLASRVQDSKYPLPICTAVMPPSKFTNVYEWFEFTPFEIGCPALNASIPAWAFGRKFENGQSVDFVPEQSLGYWLGTWGSAFALGVNELVKHGAGRLSVEEERLGKIINTFLDKSGYDINSDQLGKVRISPSKLPNFLYKVPGSELEEKESMILVDAGIHINLPFPPLLRPARNVGVIIACDASGGIQRLSALRKMVEYGKTKGLKFPPIDFDQVMRDIFTKDPKNPEGNASKIAVFQDLTDSTVPVVIYVPVFTDNEVISKQYPTSKMEYTADEAQGLIGMAYDKVMRNKELILNTIKQRVIAKGGTKQAAPDQKN